MSDKKEMHADLGMSGGRKILTLRAAAGVIKQDIQAMNAAIADLQSLSSADYDRNRQSQDHSLVGRVYQFRQTSRACTCCIWARRDMAIQCGSAIA